MGCKTLVGGGFACSCDDYEPSLEELANAEEVISKEELKQYKFQFIKMIKKYTGCESLGAYHEVMAHIENVGVDINLDDPFLDVEECVSCWDQ